MASRRHTHTHTHTQLPQADVAEVNAVKLLDVLVCRVKNVVVVVGLFVLFFEASTLKMSWWTTFCHWNISVSFYLESPFSHKKETAKRTSSVSVTCWHLTLLLILSHIIMSTQKRSLSYRNAGIISFPFGSGGHWRFVLTGAVLPE